MTFQMLAASLIKKVGRMHNGKLYGVLILMAAFCPAGFAQIDCSSSGAPAKNKLACVIPGAVTPPNYSFISNPGAAAPSGNLSNSFGFLTEDMGGEISQIPLASPASGIIFTTDPTLHVPVPSNESLGPILTQRADTIGRHKLYIAGTYQYFLLKDVDGLSLQNLPSAFFFSSTGGTTADTVGIANGRIDLKIHQFVGYITYGLTSKIDVSAAVPILRVDMRYTFSELLFNLASGQPLSAACSATNPPPCGAASSQMQSNKPGEATGVGDIVLAAKEAVWTPKRGGGIALGVEVRLPTGDAQNFLGSGATGVKPYASFTYASRVSPHFDVAYQVNGNTDLVTSKAGGRGRLPDRLSYSGGADWRVASRLTIAADILEQRLFNASRASLISAEIDNNNGQKLFSVPAISTSRNDYNRTDGSIGLKLKPFGNLLVTGNFLVKLDRGGLRERFAPLVGLSYTF
ncbi:MAG TPA: transporter [Candidatus Acidoferrales bacterium]|nr:transporter [Candidatus Acidoferrales bacterium]